MSPFAGRFRERRRHNPEHRTASHILQREIDEVGLRVYGDGMRLRGDHDVLSLDQRPAALIQYGNHARFTSDVKALQPRIKSEDVGISADRLHRGDPHAMHIDHQQASIILACRERQAVRSVDEQAVRRAATRKAVATGDPVCARINGHQIVAALDVSEDEVGGWIVLGIADFSAHRDPGDPPVGPDVDSGVGPSHFIRDKNLPVDRIISDAIGKSAVRYPGHGTERLLIDDGDLVIARNGCEDAAKLRNGQDSGHHGEAGQIGDHPARFNIENHHMAVAHVRDVEPAGAGVQALVIKARGASRKGNIRDFPQDR